MAHLAVIRYEWVKSWSGARWTFGLPDLMGDFAAAATAAFLIVKEVAWQGSRRGGARTKLLDNASKQTEGATTRQQHNQQLGLQNLDERAPHKLCTPANYRASGLAQAATAPEG